MDKKEYFKLRSALGKELKTSKVLSAALINFGLAVLASYFVFEKNNVIEQSLAIPLISILMFRCFVIMHDASHGVVSKNQKLNFLIGILTSTVCGLAFEQWKESHRSHHFWSGNFEKDPVMGFVRGYSAISPVVKKILNLCWKLWVPILGLVQQLVFWKLSLVQFMKNNKNYKAAISIFTPIIFWAVVLVALGPVKDFIIILPAATLYLLMVEIVNFPHHLGLNFQKEDKAFPVWEQAGTARTCLYPKWVSEYIVLNFNYHIEHHMFPSIPWYHLPDAHRELAKYALLNYTVDPYFKWILENKQKSLDQIMTYGSTIVPVESKKVG